MKRGTTSPSTLRWSLLVLSLIGVSLASQSIFAGSVTNPGGAPVIKMAVYQGVLTIAPGRDSGDILEFGNNGSDIASTGNIYFRPSRLAATNGVRFDGTSSSGKTDVYIPGRLCVNGACITSWPTGGGVSLWQKNGSQLETITAGRGVEIVTPNTTYAGGSALSVVGSANGVPAMYISNTSGPALQINKGGFLRGDLQINTLNVTTPITFNGLKVWYPGNDGIGTGLDADMLDGENLHLSFKASGTGSCGNNAPGACGGTYAFNLCTDKQATSGYTCIELK